MAGITESTNGRSRVRTALIGLGRIGWTLEDDPRREKPATHAGAIAANADCVLVGGCDLDEDARSNFAARYGVPVYSDTADLLRQERPDLVIIATDTETHVALIKLCLKHPIRGIICEKPLSLSVRDAEKMIRLAKRKNVPIVINHERRYAADYRAVKKTIDDGRFGDLLSLTGRLYFGRTRELGSMLWHDGCHLFDILRFLLSESDLRYRTVAKTASSMTTVASLGDLMVTVEVGKGRDHLVFEIDLSFERGRIRIGNGVFEIWESRESPFYSGYRSQVKSTEGWKAPTEYFSRMLADAVLCVSGEKDKPDSCAETEVATLRVLEMLTKGLSKQ